MTAPWHPRRNLADRVAQRALENVIRQNRAFLAQQQRLADLFRPPALAAFEQRLIKQNRAIVAQQQRLADLYKPPALAAFEQRLIKQNRAILAQHDKIKEVLEQHNRRFVEAKINLPDIPTWLKATRELMFPEPAWLARVTRTLRKAGLLPNWRSVSHLDLQYVEELLWDGIPLAIVPRASTVQALLDADNHAARRKLLASRWASITTDCLDALSGLQPTELTRMTIKAVDALRDGHVEAAQALAANVIDTALRTELHQDFKKATWLNKAKKGYQKPNVEQWAALAAWVFRPVWAAYREYYSKANLNGAPRMFYRHASAHGVSRTVCNRPNAVTAVMLAVSVVWLVETYGNDSPVQSSPP